MDRDDELAWLSFCMAEACGGRPRVVSLTGDAGTGKTRLVRELVLKARERGCAVGVGHGYEHGAVPYLAVVELLGSLHQDLERLGTTPPALPDALETERASAGALHGADVRQSQFLHALSRFVLEAAGQAPLLLVLDDAHWLDDASLRALGHLGYALSDRALAGPLSVMVLLASRPLSSTSAAGAIISRLLREDLAEPLDLPGLGRQHAMALIESFGLRHPSQQLAEFVHRLSGGNPLLVQAMVRQLQRRRAITYVDGYAVTAERPEVLELPADLTSAVALQLAELDPEQRSILEHAALLGAAFTVARLARVVELPEAHVEQALRRTEGWVRSEGAGYAFEHALLPHALTQALLATDRARIHARIAALIETDDPAAVDHGSFELFSHLVAAGPLSAPEKLQRQAERAGDHAFALCAWQDARQAYATAASAASDLATRARMALRAGVCSMQDYDFGPACTHFAQALADYRSLGDALGAAWVVAESARTELFRTPFGQLRDMAELERALAETPADELALRCRLLARIADAFYYGRRPADSEHAATEALECARRTRDDALALDACIPLALAQLQSLRIREAAETYRLAVQHAEALGDAWWETAPRVRYASVLELLGQPERAAQQLALARAAAERSDNSGELVLADAYTAGRAAMLGDAERVEELLGSVLRRAPRFKAPWAPAVAVPAAAYARFVRGRFSEARDALSALDEPGRILEEVGGAIHGLTVVYRDLIAAFVGEPDAAAPGESRRARVIRYASRTRPGVTDGSALGVACSLVEVAELRAIPEALLGPMEVLASAHAQGVVVCLGWPTLVARALALGELALEREAQATRWFEQALADAERIGAAVELLRTHLDYARMLAGRADAASQQRARDLLEAALPGLRELGLAPFLTRAENLGRALGMHLPNSAGSAAGESLARADKELLRQLTTPATESALADRWLLRMSSARARIDALYGRIGVTGRLEAAAYALEAGIVPQPQTEIGSVRSLMVTDLEGFTGIVQELGDIEARQLMRMHNRILRLCIADHRGNEITHTGDGIIASFRSAAEAIECAGALLDRFEQYNRTASRPLLRVRVGLHTGHALPEEDRLFGNAVNTAVRICSRCEAGHILASEEVQRSCVNLPFRFEPRGEHVLKGLAAPVRLVEVTARVA